MRKLLFLLVPLLLTLVAAGDLSAQDDAPGDNTINYDNVVQGTITSGAFFDRWRLDALPGDVIYVEMSGFEGLAPFVAILDPGLERVANSDENAPPNSTVATEWTVVEAGTYFILTSRIGVETGTTTGVYLLTVRNANPRPVDVNPFAEVTFRCQDSEAAVMLNLRFRDPDSPGYRISVYGLDGLEPVIRLTINAPGLGQALTDCSADETGMAGDSVSVPDVPGFVVADGSNPAVARVSVLNRTDNAVTDVALTIGASGVTSGRYILVVEGFAAGSATDADTLFVAPGPLARSVPLTVYAVRAAGSRLDPQMTLLPQTDAGSALVCDDAGRARGCPAIPAFTGYGVRFADGTALPGTRFDAGLLVAVTAESPEAELRVTPRPGSGTSGFYALVIVGIMPPR